MRDGVDTTERALNYRNTRDSSKFSTATTIFLCFFFASWEPSNAFLIFLSIVCNSLTTSAPIALDGTRIRSRLTPYSASFHSAPTRTSSSMVKSVARVC